MLNGSAPSATDGDTAKLREEIVRIIGEEVQDVAAAEAWRQANAERAADRILAKLKGI
jgi:hypothetical protein